MHRPILTQPSWLIGNLHTTVHQCCGDNAQLAANIISYARHQFCSTECLAMPATSNQDIVPHLCGGYRVRGQSKGAPFVMSHSGMQSASDGERDRGEKEQDRTGWGGERGLQDCVDDKRWRNQFWTKWERLICEWNKENCDKGRYRRKEGTGRREKWKDDRKEISLIGDWKWQTVKFVEED